LGVVDIFAKFGSLVMGGMGFRCMYGRLGVR
jgi:hypothetical protein